MGKQKVLKNNSVITGINFHSSFYERLSSLIMIVTDPQNWIKLKEESPVEFNFHLETLLILVNTLDAQAGIQDLIEELDPENHDR